MRAPRAAVAAVSALVALATLSGCADDRETTVGQREDTANQDTAMALGHVHGLGTDPADGTLYAASHYGVFRFADGPPTRVADRWQDTMGFTVVGPDLFLGSGHPDLREELPVQLGLIRSDDAAESWEPVSLSGKADFHALEATSGGERVVGFDAVSGRLLESTDSGMSWQQVARDDLVDLALDPDDSATAQPSGRVLGTRPDGSLVLYQLTDGSATPLQGAPPLVFVDWPTTDLLVGLAADGLMYVSSNAGAQWTRVGQVPGQAQALDVTTGRWHAATSQGVFESTDDGRTWRPLVQMR